MTELIFWYTSTIFLNIKLKFGHTPSLFPSRVIFLWKNIKNCVELLSKIFEPPPINALGKYWTRIGSEILRVKYVSGWDDHCCHEPKIVELVSHSKVYILWFVKFLLFVNFFVKRRKIFVSSLMHWTGEGNLLSDFISLFLKIELNFIRWFHWYFFIFIFVDYLIH